MRCVKSQEDRLEGSKRSESCELVRVNKAEDLKDTGSDKKEQGGANDSKAP